MSRGQKSKQGLLKHIYIQLSEHFCLSEKDVHWFYLKDLQVAFVLEVTEMSYDIVS